MSIYASDLAFTEDEIDAQPAPLLYHGSHHYPDPSSRGGHIDFGVIPGHIAEGGGYDEAHEHRGLPCHRPFLRIGFNDPFGNEYPDRKATPTSGTLLLDATQVEELRDYLNGWLDGITGGARCIPEVDS